MSLFGWNWGYVLPAVEIVWADSGHSSVIIGFALRGISSEFLTHFCSWDLHGAAVNLGEYANLV